MLTLYYCPGACSTAAHIALEETGAGYGRRFINLKSGEQNAPAFRKVNPRGQVPALDVGETIITESVAILSYIGRSFPDAQLLPSDAVGDARCLAVLAWIARTVRARLAGESTSCLRQQFQVRLR
jgi:glutathione S-transferase